LVIAVVVGIVIGNFHYPYVYETARIIGEVFVRLLQMISLPVVSLSIIATLANLDRSKGFAKLGRNIAFYTFCTTLLAAATALILFELLQPAKGIPLLQSALNAQTLQTSYGTYLLQVIPDNFLKPYTGGNMIGIILISALLGTALFHLSAEAREVPRRFFSGLFLAILQITRWLTLWIPVVVMCFVITLIHELQSNVSLGNLGRYLLAVVGSNVWQAVVTLPVLLRVHGISPIRCIVGMSQALSVAFFSKSSVATMPTTLDCIENNLQVSPKISRFTIPLCATINMNGCASFILVTVLFVAQANGMVFSTFDKIVAVFVSTLAAIGNAGIPMGCFLLSTALLTAINVPVDYMGIILPFFGFLDMLETAVNTWSDACVTLMVAKTLPIDLSAPLEDGRLTS
jgi:Na+/H+-dicarboxylate symporter